MKVVGSLTRASDSADAFAVGGGVTDGSKGDVIVSGSGTNWKLDKWAQRLAPVQGLGLSIYENDFRTDGTWISAIATFGNRDVPGIPTAIAAKSVGNGTTSQADTVITSQRFPFKSGTKFTPSFTMYAITGFTGRVTASMNSYDTDGIFVSNTVLHSSTDRRTTAQPSGSVSTFSGAQTTFFNSSIELVFTIEWSTTLNNAGTVWITDCNTRKLLSQSDTVTGQFASAGAINTFSTLQKIEIYSPGGTGYNLMLGNLYNFDPTSGTGIYFSPQGSGAFDKGYIRTVWNDPEYITTIQGQHKVRLAIGTGSTIILEANSTGVNVTGTIASTDAITAPNYYTAKCASLANFANTGPTATVLTASAVGITTFDGFTPALNDTVVIKNQTLLEQNGVYKVTTVGTASIATILTRVPELNTWANISQNGIVLVKFGPYSTSATIYQISTFTGAGTLGTTAINFNKYVFADANGLLTASTLKAGQFGSGTVTAGIFAGDPSGSGSGTNVFTAITSIFGGADGNFGSVPGIIRSSSVPVIGSNAAGNNLILQSGAGVGNDATATVSIQTPNTAGATTAQTVYVTRAAFSNAGLAVTGTVTGSNLSNTNTGDETYTTITTKLAVGSGGGTTNFLRADGTFVAPPAGGGGSTYTVVVRATSNTETATAGQVIVLCSATTTQTMSLPTAVGNTAKYVFKKTANGGTVIIDPSGTETIDGGLTATLSNQYESITLVSDNANWSII